MRTFLAALSFAALASAAVAGDKLEVTKQDCLNLVAHQPAPDVAYKPDTDVYGRKVAPATIPSTSPIQIPKEIVIDIGVDLNEKYGIGLDAGGDKRYTAATQTFGKVAVNPLTGQATWNGTPLDGADTEAIRAACRAKYGL